MRSTLPLESLTPPHAVDVIGGPPLNPCSLETDFPATAVSATATAESWRKEIHRPASHTHKWWAQRLGSVFRSLIIAAYSSDAAETLARINTGVRLDQVRLLDPFAGSGTTLVEAQKLGASCTGIDINPVASLVQRQALQPWNHSQLLGLFGEVESMCKDEIDLLHVDAFGDPVLYYFWVAQARCPVCHEQVELFSSYVFAKHAYTNRNPLAQAVCPVCHVVEPIDLSEGRMGQCINGHSLDVAAPVSGQQMTCTNGHKTRIVDALDSNMPTYRMYAKLVLQGELKRYTSIDSFDVKLYSTAEQKLSPARDRRLVQPSGDLEDGYNTRQAMRWGFNKWEKFFNARQLYCLGQIGEAVRSLKESPEREALCALFSGTLEFNNMFCSFKGEGTGAVRHMFSHHILKPERTPLEAHPWGTPKSSGSFSTLFRSRILRAHEYKRDPHDFVLEYLKPERRRGISQSLYFSPESSWEVITGDASRLPHDDNTFDLVVTDPPYFDNVHYSELADFFHAWLKNVRPYNSYPFHRVTTRNEAEVQGTDVDRFSDSLARIFAESARVLKPAGLMAFSFHHGTAIAWRAVAAALRTANLTITSVQPVKAEMSTSSTKNGAKEPNNLDSIIVCRPTQAARAVGLSTAEESARAAVAKLTDLRDGGVGVGLGDVRSVVTGAVIALATQPDWTSDLDLLMAQAEGLAQSACKRWNV